MEQDAALVGDAVALVERLRGEEALHVEGDLFEEGSSKDEIVEGRALDRLVKLRVPREAAAVEHQDLAVHLRGELTHREEEPLREVGVGRDHVVSRVGAVAREEGDRHHLHPAALELALVDRVLHLGLGELRRLGVAPDQLARHALGQLTLDGSTLERFEEVERARVGLEDGAARTKGRDAKTSLVRDLLVGEREQLAEEVLGKGKHGAPTDAPPRPP